MTSRCSPPSSILGASPKVVLRTLPGRRSKPATNERTLGGSLRLAIVVGLASLAAFGCSSPETEELAAAREALGVGRYQEAIEHYTEVTLQAPGSPEAAQALYDVALIHYLRRRDLDAARSTFRKILSSYPGSEVARDARRLLARMYEQDLGEPDKAIREYELLLDAAQDPNERRALLLRIANCRYTMDDLEGAADAYRHVVEVAPRDEESVGAYLRLAHIQRLRGSADEALENLEAVLRVSEEPRARRKAYRAQAEILAEEGRFADAQSWLAAAKDEFAGDEEIKALATRIEDQEEDRRRAERGEQPAEPVRWGRGRP